MRFLFELNNEGSINLDLRPSTIQLNAKQNTNLLSLSTIHWKTNIPFE